MSPPRRAGSKCGTATVSHCIFRGNIAGTNSGGAFVSDLNTGAGAPTNPLVLTNCLFVGNRANNGGAIYAEGPTDISNCTIVGNAATLNGGAIQAFRPTTLRNCILWGNTATNGAQLATSSNFVVVTVERCDVAGGQAGVYLTAGSSLSWGAGNLALDPLLSDADGADNDPATLADNDYRLGAFSPCIDAGGNAFVPADALDLDGDGNTGERIPFDLDFAPRFVDDPSVADTGAGTAPIVDIGAYERP